MTDQRVVLVTGASGHLGSAVALRCAAAGWSVAVHYRSNEGRAQSVVDEIRASGGTAQAFGADLVGAGAGNRASSLVDDVITSFGQLDGVVANSAEQGIVEFADLHEADWLAMLDANLVATTRLVSAAVPRMVSGGSIVTVSSVEAAMAFPRHAHYAASKAALESFTRSLALDIAPRGMRANAVAPGLIDREGLAADWPEGYTWWTQTAPTGRPVSGDEVAAVIEFLLSPQALGVNGVVIPVDGGWSASARAPF